MPAGQPFYTDVVAFLNDVTPPALDADYGNAVKAALREASARIVVLETRPDAVHAVGNSGAALTLDAASASGNVKTVTLTADCTFTFTGATAGRAAVLELALRQDATGGRLVVWPTSVRWPDGVVPAIASAGGSVSVVILVSYDGGATWLGNLAGAGYA
jgi:hypothetical protein